MSEIIINKVLNNIKKVQEEQENQETTLNTSYVEQNNDIKNLKNEHEAKDPIPMPLIIDEYDGRLTCPNCTGQDLHQYKIEIFNRGEDKKFGEHILVDGLDVIIDDNLKGNPSKRRQGLKVYFYCECCDYEIALNIYQHKGSTYLNTEIGNRIREEDSEEFIDSVEEKIDKIQSIRDISEIKVQINK